jgi:hypothetical protein
MKLEDEAENDQNPSAMPLMQAAQIICEVHTADSDSPQGFSVYGRPPDFVRVQEDRYWQAWRVLRRYAGKREGPSKRKSGGTVPTCSRNSSC